MSNETGPPQNVEPVEGRKRRKCRFKLSSFIPVFEWLPQYKWKEDFVFDLSAGITLAFVNIPQSMAFAVLANVPIIYGLYTACFASFVYSLLGTATLSSYGPVAVASILTGETIENLSSDYDREELAASIMFTVGVFYLILYILQLGVVVAIFRKPFISAFISGCVCHVYAKSTKMLLGIRSKSHYGMFNFYYNLKSLIESVPDSNIPTVITSLVVILILVSNTLILKKMIAKRTKFILPVEVIVLAGATFFSYLFDFNAMGVPVVGFVPSGPPRVIPPNFKIVPHILPESVIIGTVNYATAVSMTLLFNKNLRPNQESLAIGISNVICASFQCIPIGNSMMRAIVVMSVGVKTLLCTMISSVILLFVILFAGPLFETLPYAVLGGIIVVSCASLIYKNVIILPSLFKSKLEDAFIWCATFSSTIVFDVTLGLLVGAVLSLRQILREVVELEKAAEKLKDAQQQPESEKLMEATDNV